MEYQERINGWGFTVCGLRLLLYCEADADEQLLIFDLACWVQRGKVSTWVSDPVMQTGLDLIVQRIDIKRRRKIGR